MVLLVLGAHLYLRPRREAPTEGRCHHPHRPFCYSSSGFPGRAIKRTLFQWKNTWWCHISCRRSSTFSPSCHLSSSSPSFCRKWIVTPLSFTSKSGPQKDSTGLSTCTIT